VIVATLPPSEADDDAGPLLRFYRTLSIAELRVLECSWQGERHVASERTRRLALLARVIAEKQS
jgi:hypothetical protein